MDPDIDLERDQGAILALYRRPEKEKALFQKVPQAKEFWDYEKNASLDPSFFSYGSGQSVWWKCEKGHSWRCPISGFSAGQRCPYCSGRRIWPGFNDLASCDPYLASQWHPTLNGDLTPDQVTRHCGKRVWWLCESGHVWSAVVASRSDGQNCPHCKSAGDCLLRKYVEPITKTHVFSYFIAFDITYFPKFLITLRFFHQVALLKYGKTIHIYCLQIWKCAIMQH